MDLLDLAGFTVDLDPWSDAMILRCGTCPDRAQGVIVAAKQLPTLMEMAGLAVEHNRTKHQMVGMSQR